jgi:hypothetical protein
MSWLWTPRLHFDTSKFSALEPMAEAFQTRKKIMDDPCVRVTRDWVNKWQLGLVKELEMSNLGWVSMVFHMYLCLVKLELGLQYHMADDYFQYSTGVVLPSTISLKYLIDCIWAQEQLDTDSALRLLLEAQLLFDRTQVE